MAQAPKPTILFVSALQEETDPLWYDPRFGWSEPREAGDSIWYRSCDVESLGRTYQFVSAAACEMGLIATTILTAKLVLRWNPVLVIGFGICAGMKERQLGLGDVVISTKALLYQFGRSINGQLQHEKREEGLHAEMESIARQFAVSWPSVEVARKFQEKSERTPKATVGAYASADFVSKDEFKMAKAASLDPDVLAVDMETYAILRTARRLGVRYAAVSVKAVSDHGDRNKAKSGRDFVKFMSKEAAVGLAHQFMESCKDVTANHREGWPRQSITAPGDGPPAVLAICPSMRSYEILRNHLTNCVTTYPESAERPECCTGKLENTVVHLGRFPKGDYGHVDAALWATCLIAAFTPQLVLLVGPCGGFSEKGCGVGDLIVPNRAVHFQYGAFKDGEWLPEVRAVDIHDRIRGFLFANAKKILETALEDVVAAASEHRPEGVQPKWHIEPIASSDLYVGDSGTVSDAIKRDRKMVAVEMEGYAVMRTAVHTGVPLGCLIVRSVADFADKEGPRYSDFANHVCAGVVVSLLSRGLNDLVSRAVGRDTVGL